MAAVALYSWEAVAGSVLFRSAAAAAFLNAFADAAVADAAVIGRCCCEGTVAAGCVAALARALAVVVLSDCLCSWFPYCAAFLGVPDKAATRGLWLLPHIPYIAGILT